MTIELALAPQDIPPRPGLLAQRLAITTSATPARDGLRLAARAARRWPCWRRPGATGWPRCGRHIIEPSLEDVFFGCGTERPMEFSQILTIAGKEFRDRMRNRWVLAGWRWCSPVFSLAIACFGGAQQGTVGFRSIEFTIASLVSLVIYLIPLIALLLGFDAIVGERERGSLDLLLSLPITRIELLLGKYLGLAAALALSTLAGFGLVAVLLYPGSSTGGLFHYGGFVAQFGAAGLAFLEPGRAAVGPRPRAHARLGLAIATWFFFVLVFDLLLLGVGGHGGARRAAMAYLLLLNPGGRFPHPQRVFAGRRAHALYGLDQHRSAAGQAMADGLGDGGLDCGATGLASWRFKP